MTSEIFSNPFFIALVGAIVGGIISGIVAFFTIFKQQKYVESAKFRAVFIPTLMRLQNCGEDINKIIPQDILISQHAAVLTYRCWVSKCKLSEYDRAWDEYRSGMRISAPGSIDMRKVNCDLCLSNVEKLLSFSSS